MTDEQRPTCSAGDIDPQDWFIRSDGKQYSDDEFLTEAERRGIARSVLPIVGETSEEHEARVSSAINAAIGNRRRAALVRRRKAKEACWSCPLRQQCLEMALERNEVHGTWGGFYEEELREIRQEQARRRRRKGQQENPIQEES